jgi:hypothetical protein
MKIMGFAVIVRPGLLLSASTATANAMGCLRASLA